MFSTVVQVSSLLLISLIGSAHVGAQETPSSDGVASSKEPYAISARVRLAYENVVNEAHGAVPRNTSGSLLLRGLVSGQIDMGRFVRFELGLISATELGRPGGPGPINEDGLDVLAAVVELQIVGALDEKEARHAGLRIGRQKLRYGQGRLVDSRSGPNVSRNFDGLLFRAGDKKVEGDLLLAAEVPLQPGVFDNLGGSRSWLWGLHLGSEPGGLLAIGLEAYYFGVRQDDRVYASASGREIRHSVGTRVWTAPSSLQFEAEATHQFGQLDVSSNGEQVSIDAWGLALRASYTSTHNPSSGTLILEGGYTSGDADPSDQRLETFRSPYPALRFAGPTAGVAPGNLMGLSLQGSILVSTALTLGLQARSFYRVRLQDGTYSPAGIPQRLPSGSSRTIGHGLSATASYKAHEQLMVFAMAEGFRPGAFLQANPPATNSLFLTVNAEMGF